ncbi:transcriptional regulator, MerR family [Cellulomonas flavigena DSM 20109]|uniref:Transcriptional regulator, MerR family n=1 Tax=Cellulomonas flavigena (strain ATCC 482 / DSM 20109 / BCRC 11376 / JCM 18109 / NBRC 3775 / NCIMB 8073 / NRS 134) TaxID=446466 RepID=D5UE57_CELFN|nr:MerR family DNA-binding protein [Cellulomonas flavigena]ADG76533.1 transcriptional regulator, MerR family [Cellulomonas flavigena DSM 20109]
MAERAGLTTKALRFYEQAGVLPVPARAASGYRDYDQGVLTRLGFVRAAQAAGLTLAEIRTIIEVRESEGPPCEHVTALLDRHAAALDVRIAELEATRTEVRRLRDRAATLDPAACGEDGVCQVLPTGAPVSGATPAATPTVRTAGR